MIPLPLHPVSWERMARAVDKVRERLQRSTAALEIGGIPYAVAGGHAVAAWVASADAGGVRNCSDIDIIVRQSDYELANHALTAAGFVYASIDGIHCLLDKPDLKVRDAVKILITGERVRADDFWPVPDIGDAKFAPSANLWHLSLESLVGMCLSSFRLVEKVYLRDLADVELIDSTWPSRFSPKFTHGKAGRTVFFIVVLLGLAMESCHQQVQPNDRTTTQLPLFGNDIQRSWPDSAENSAGFFAWLQCGFES